MQHGLYPYHNQLALAILRHWCHDTRHYCYQSDNLIMAQPPPGKRNASKVVPVIPRSLSRRHPGKPASLPQSGSPLHKEQTKPTSRSRRDSLVRDQGPLIATTPTPAVSAHPPTTSASSSTYEHSFEHHDCASSNSDFSMTASRKGPLAILSTQDRLLIHPRYPVQHHQRLQQHRTLSQG